MYFAFSLNLHDQCVYSNELTVPDFILKHLTSKWVGGLMGDSFELACSQAHKPQRFTEHLINLVHHRVGERNDFASLVSSTF